MAKKKIDFQGEIIDEVRKARVQVGREFKANRKRFFDESKKLAKELGMHYGTPRKRKKKDAA
jgi:DNA-directed RNA polymerase specialized sigma subunit